MKPTDNFSEIKQEILDRARRAEACRPEYGRAYAAEDMQGLCTVIKDNFNWCCRSGVIDARLLEKYKSDFAACDIYVNTDAERGFLLCDNATVEAWNNATVEACGNATVEAWDNATVRAWNNATVRAWNNATVRAWNSAYCSSWSLIECKLSDNALYRVRSTNTVYYANDSMKFQKQ